ncbi:MAG: Gfo/Idh/MocA family oxidoreductase [Verrucomicrobia bacterium]|nr:Gfo/Idh/MocA family oxidoreductase [Verrucomicrobiota bacterium]
MKELQIGVIGFGLRAGLVQHAHRPDSDVRVVALADVNEQALGRFREKYGADTFVTSNYRDLLAQRDIDAVIILSPDFLHAEHAVTALEAGKAVYLEKPMAVTIDGCDRILRAAQQRKTRLYVGHNLRHHAVMRKMKELIGRGAIGAVKAGWCRHFVGYGGDFYFKDWHAERSKTTGLLLHKGTHDIDILHWLCGGYTRRVNAMGALTLYDRVKNCRAPDEKPNPIPKLDNWPPLAQKGLNPNLDVEDLSMMLMELDNGVLCSYEQCHYTPDVWRNYTIIGTEGRLENFNDRPGEAVIRVWNRRTIYNAEGDEQHFIPKVEGGHGGADPVIMAEFLRFVRDGGQTETSPIAARQSVAAGCMATQSLRNCGIPCDVPPLDPEVATYFNRQN